MSRPRTLPGRPLPAGPPPERADPAQDRAAARARGDLGPPGVPGFYTPEAEANLLQLEASLRQRLVLRVRGVPPGAPVTNPLADARRHLAEAEAACERLYLWSQVARFENGESAHDFRNILGTLRGHVELLRAALAACPEEGG